MLYFNDKHYVDVSTLITDKFPFYAHLKGDRKETLKEHTELCKKYFGKIVESKELDRTFVKLEDIFLKNVGDECTDLFRKLLINTIALHDIGKINPLFQNRKMENKSHFKDMENFYCIETKHSILSSVLYIDCFIDKILNLHKEDKLKLLPFLYLNAYVISKHHGNLDEFYKFLDGFYEGGEAFKGISIFNNSYKDVYIKGFNLSENRSIKVCKYIIKKYLPKISEEESIYLYTYERLLYSLLVACDFYATTEFMNGVELNEFGEITQINEFYDAYKNTDVYRSIRKYDGKEYKKDSKDLTNEKNINILRDELFLDAEGELSKNKDEDIFFLEAPTGSGKSNVSMNLSFKFFKDNPSLKKIFYVYPFNTLVEQNLKILKKVFGEGSEVFNRIAIINSISPIKMDENNKKSDDNEDNYKYYAKALLNRQFLNYPMILTTHVSLFNTMFNASKESAFSFHQLANSVVVLDEIQSYKNSIWTEIISFLKAFAKVLNMKVIIMSATLPNLNLLTVDDKNTANLIKNREKYFDNPLFKNRVMINYDLMDEKDTANVLYEYVKNNSNKKKKILIEFIKKQSAYDFYAKLKNDGEIGSLIELMTGDDNSIERQRIIDIITSKDAEKNGIILVATQVIEAGVDIDMDIGYKDISKLDSDEQFMGRINRSCLKSGIVYFFNLDSTKGIYKNDVRVNKELSLLNYNMREILKNKNFKDYYMPVLNSIKDIYNTSISSTNLSEFFKEQVGKLNFKAVENRMKLIEDDNWSMSVYLCRIIKNSDGTIIDGEKVWKSYKELLKNNSMDYAEKQVKLSEITSKINYFIYQIKKNNAFVYTDKIGELYCIDDGEQYFDNGKINKERFISGVGEFI